MSATPPSTRSGLAASLAAIGTVVRGIADPLEADEAVPSLRRIARALLESGALEGRSDLTAAATALATAEVTSTGGAATRLMALLELAVQEEGGRNPDAILLIEDDSQFCRALERALQGAGRRILSAATAEAARELLRRETVGLVVLDLILPDSDGRNILLELRSNPRTAALPVFIVSARFGTRTKAECFALGADAYFEKPVDLETFAVAVGSRLERQIDPAQLARRDSLTGLPNRAAFLEGWTRLREDSPADVRFALAVLDLDHFRWVEDSWGRQFAESVLRRSGTRMAMALRQAALFARWDGAEFIALFSGRGAAEAGTVVDQALIDLRRVEFRPGGPTPLTITFSAGVADVPRNLPMEEGIALADRLRYVAKASGRNRVVAGEPPTALPPRRILLAEDDPNMVKLLTRHLRGEGFEVVAFPDGAEALAHAPESGAALVISDIEMPNLDGLDLLESLRARSEFRHIPIMMLTAMGDESYVVRAFELGADDYVLKPFSIREVTARVRRLLRRPCLEGVPLGA